MLYTEPMKKWPIWIVFWVGLPLWAQTLSDNWRYSAGDDAGWSAPDYDHSSWQLLPRNQLPEGEWPGVAWFRLDLDMRRTDTAFSGFRVGFYGDVQVYLDGELLSPISSINAAFTENDQPLLNSHTQKLYAIPPELLLGQGTGYLALRCEGLSWDNLSAARLPRFICIELGDLSDDLISQAAFVEKITFHQMLMIGLCLALSVVHGLMFFNYRRFRANLHYAGLNLSGAALVYLFFQLYLADTFAFWLLLQRSITALMSANMLCAVGLAHALTVGKSPKTYRWIASLFLLLSLWGLFQPFVLFEIQGSLVVIAFAEIGRVLLVIRRKKSNAPMASGRLLTWGALTSMAGFLIQLLVLNVPALEILEITALPLFLYSPLPIMLGMSLYLSHQFAQTNRHLAQRLVQVKELSKKATAQEVERIRLEAENHRKNQELEAARTLQLSLLPETLPSLPGYQVAVYMKTATEVGGDFYDFDTSGEIATAVIGDATGHGLKAGNMVIAVKTLFNAFSQIERPGEILERISPALAGLHFRAMFMSLTAIKFREDGLALSMAGMPPALIYRAASGLVEPCHHKNIPLGVFRGIKYGTLEVRLLPNDVMLLMTDGLMERFNPADVMFSLARIESVLAETAHETPEQIIYQLVQAGEIWAEGRANDDDITFMVLKRDSHKV